MFIHYHSGAGSALVRCGINLVPDNDLRYSTGSDVFKNGCYRGHLLLPIRAGRVDDMQQQIGLCGFFQSGMKGRDQFMWQVANEADGVGEDYLPGAFDEQPSRCRVECCEQLIR